jgi:hypothetical protein
LVVNQLLSTETLDEKLDQITTFLEEVGERIRSGNCELEELSVAKTLTRDPQLYPDKNAQPHVAVALRLNAAGGRQLKSGDTVKYVVCLVKFQTDRIFLKTFLCSNELLFDLADYGRKKKEGRILFPVDKTKTAKQSIILWTER